MFVVTRITTEMAVKRPSARRLLLVRRESEGRGPLSPEWGSGTAAIQSAESPRRGVFRVGGELVVRGDQGLVKDDGE